MYKLNRFKTLSVLTLTAGLLSFPAFSEGKEASAEKKTSKGMIEKYDTDKDGVLSEDEKTVMKEKKAAAKAEWLEKYDTDKDGKVSKEEKQAAKEAKMKGKAEGKEAKMKKHDHDNKKVKMEDAEKK